MKRWKMRFKILLLCLGSTLLGLMLQTLLFQNSFSQLIYEKEKEESLYSMQNMQDDLYTYIKSVEDSLIRIYNETEFMNDLKRKKNITEMRAEYPRFAYNFVDENFVSSSQVKAMYIYNPDHKIISNYRWMYTPKHNYLTDIYLEPEQYNAEIVKKYFESDETRMMISSYYNSYREKEMIRFVMKIYNYMSIGVKVGYIVCDVDSKDIAKILGKYRTDEEMYIWLQPAGDRPILSVGEFSDDFANTYKDMQRQIYEGQTELITDTEQNKLLFGAQQKKYNLGAYSLMPSSVLNRNGDVLTKNLILITGIMLLVISISVIYISRILSHPLEMLTRTVERIQNGDTHLRTNYLKNDEVGELGKSFNRMLDQIEDLVAQNYKKEILLNQAEYQALQAQINPHFLYNTLDTMGSLAGIQGNIEVKSLCQSLAHLFRYSLNMKQPLATIKQEIGHLKNYIYVMNVRLKNEITYDFKIKSDILDYTLPRISIQPLVENAINHGLRNKKGEKKVVVRGYEETNGLIISVEDNGVGMTEEKVREIFDENDLTSEKKRTSIGILNIHKRLQFLYGEEYGVFIESELDKGTCVYLKIPMNQITDIDESED